MNKLDQKKICLDAPTVGETEKHYLLKAIDEGYVSSVGPFIGQFEECFSKQIGIKSTVAVQSGTAALHMALKQAGVSLNDEVIIPVVTFAASVNPILYLGAKPVFVDVDLKTWNLDIQAVKEAITPRTKAIVPVHLYGNPCDMPKIVEIAKENNLSVIEDATEALGSTLLNQAIGTFGDFGCFSFNGNKMITTGGGGAVIGKNEEDLKNIRFLINQAKSHDEELNHCEVGFNYRMTNIEAALGIAQLEQFNGFIKKKEKISAIYKEQLEEIDSIAFQEKIQDAKQAFWMNCIVSNSEKQMFKIQEQLTQNNIQTRRIFKPLTGYKAYSEYANNKYINAQKIYESGLCIPSSTLNSEDDIYFVCEKIKKAVKA